MIELDNHWEEVGRMLGSVTNVHRLVFAASCCETMSPNYLGFTILERRGDWDCISGTLDALWIFAESPEGYQGKLDELAGSVADAIPDIINGPEGTWLTTMAVDAGLAILKTVELCSTGSVSIAIDVARLATDSLDDFLMRVNDPNPRPHVGEAWFSNFILGCPLMQAELERQLTVLSRLQSNTSLTNDDIRNIRSYSSGFGVQPIRRHLIIAH